MIAGISIGSHNSAAADGLGGLSALGFLVFVPMALLAAAAVSIGFVLRATDRTRAAWIFGSLNAVFGLLVVLYGAQVLGMPLLAALNPWSSPDNTVIASLSLLIIVSNLVFFVRQLAGRILVGLALPLFLAWQFIGTPGRTIHYDFDPLQGSNEKVHWLSPHHTEWNGRILHSEQDKPYFGSARAAVTKTADGRYRVTVAAPDKDPRTTSNLRKRDRWIYRYPFQPSHMAKILIDDASMLDEDWRATDAMLIRAISTNSRDTVRLLLTYGADVNHINERGMTPLSYAVLGHKAELARLLVDAGADPNQRLGDGNTVLHRVVGRGMMGLSDVELSLELGADPTVPNAEDQTPIDIAEESATQTERLQPSDIRKRHQVLDLLLTSAAKQGLRK